MQNFIEISPRDIDRNVFTALADEWMLITAKKDGKVNTMTAAWGGLGHIWNKDAAYIVVRPQRFTKEFLDASETFSLTFFNNSYRKKLSYLGTVSGRDEDKIEKTGLTTVYDGKTPYFAESELVLICRKMYAEPLKEAGFIDLDVMEKNYPEKDFHTLYVAEIVKAMRICE